MFLSYEGKDPLGKGKWKRTMFSLDGYTSHLFKGRSEFKQKKIARDSTFYLSMAIGANVLL